MKKEQKQRERGFEVELGSMADLRSVSLTNGGQGEGALVEGTIGVLRRAGFAEGRVLEVVGSRGTIRIDLRRGDVTRE